MSDSVRIRFTGTIMLPVEDLEDVFGDELLCAQHALDYSGVTIETAGVDDFMADDDPLEPEPEVPEEEL